MLRSSEMDKRAKGKLGFEYSSKQKDDYLRIMTLTHSTQGDEQIDHDTHNTTLC